MIDLTRLVKWSNICNVFFIVLDLRLTKVGTRRSPFFYASLFQPFLYRKNKFIGIYLYYNQKVPVAWKATALLVMWNV